MATSPRTQFVAALKAIADPASKEKVSRFFHPDPNNEREYSPPSGWFPVAGSIRITTCHETHRAAGRACGSAKAAKIDRRFRYRYVQSLRFLSEVVRLPLTFFSIALSMINPYVGEDFAKGGRRLSISNPLNRLGSGGGQFCKGAENGPSIRCINASRAWQVVRIRFDPANAGFIGCATTGEFNSPLYTQGRPCFCPAVTQALGPPPSYAMATAACS